VVLPGTSSSTKIGSALPQRESQRSSGKARGSFGDALRSQQKRQDKALREKRADQKARSLAAQKKRKSDEEGYGAQPKSQKDIEGQAPKTQKTEGRSSSLPVNGEPSQKAKGQAQGFSEESGEVLKSQDQKNFQMTKLDRDSTLTATDAEATQVPSKAVGIFEGEETSMGASPLSKNISAHLKNSEVQVLQDSIKAQDGQNSKALNEALKLMDTSDLSINPELALDKVGLAGAHGESQGAATSSFPNAMDGAKDGAAASALLSGIAQGDSQQGGESSENSDSSSGQQNFLETLGGRTGDSSAVTGGVASKSFTQALADAQANPEGKSIDNMGSIVRQVRTIVNDGGGTMNIELSPEGMGNINLKVAVENGQVNVEMLADNQVAKKALEETLVDMKASLESQKLNVETLKVDFSKDYEKDFSQSRNFMNDQQRRDDAQQFMEQFRQERDERVSSLFGGMQSYIREPKRPELGLSAGRSYFGNSKGRSVNLVA